MKVQVQSPPYHCSDSVSPISPQVESTMRLPPAVIDVIRAFAEQSAFLLRCCSAKMTAVSLWLKLLEVFLEFFEEKEK